MTCFNVRACHLTAVISKNWPRHEKKTFLREDLSQLAFLQNLNVFVVLLVDFKILLVSISKFHFV